MAQFGRQNRILTGGHYKAVFDNRLRFHSRFFSFHLMRNTASYSRVGIAVSKKVSKLAVERNRIKRQIRDSFRHYLETESMTDIHTDFVVVAKFAASEVENRVIRADLDQNWVQSLKYAKPATQSGQRKRKANVKAGA
ncbi:MAG: ribonuclease P protein component [Acidiferrobacterales bacterium]|nr:ribonuclease P protein component [Acidiferrobacterales bacterium]